MRDHDRETQKDGAQSAPPQKAKAGGDHERAHKQADGHAPARPDILRDERAAHPANAEPLAELLSQLQHSHGNAYVQRFVGEAGGEKAKEEAKPVASQAPSVASGLDAGTRSLMESAFGESFGDVRAHTGAEAERMNEELGARAVTRGRDIYFKEGEYNPATREGRELLAHELAHIVQQSGGAGAAQTSSTGRDGDAHEQEADRAASAVLSGERAHVEKSASAPAYQLQRPGGGGHPMGPITEELGDIRLTPGHSRIPLGAGHVLEVDVSSQGGTDRVSITVPDGLTSRMRPISSRSVHVERDPGGTRRRTLVVTSRSNSEGPRILFLAIETQNRMYTMLLYFPGMPTPPPVPTPPAPGGRR